MKKKYLVVLLFLLTMLPLVASQETVNVKGLVLDNLRNRVDGAFLSYQYQGQVVNLMTTDSTGKYNVEVPLLEGDDVIYLEFSKEDYRSTAHVIYKRDGKIIVEEQDFDECYPKCNSADCMGPLPDAKHSRFEFDSVSELEEKEFNANFYPFSNVYLFWDEEVIIDISYDQKNCFSLQGGGNSNLKKNHVLGNALPLSYDADVTLTTQGGKESRISIYNDEFGRGVKIFKEGDEAVFEICESQVCEEPTGEFLLYILLGGILFVCFVFLIFLLKKKTVP